MNEKEARRIVAERSNGVCELRLESVCLGRASNYMHRKRKGHCSLEERWNPANALHGCGSGTTGCHGYAHSHPAEAVSEGWEVKSWDNPLTRPVRLWQGYVVLDQEGGWTNLGPELPTLFHTAKCALWTDEDCDCGGVA